MFSKSKWGWGRVLSAWVLGFSFFQGAWAHEEEFLWRSLPMELPGDYSHSCDFIQFFQDEDSSYAPLALGSSMNGVNFNTTRDRDITEQLFEEKFFVKSPAPIQVNSEKGVTKWLYPVGFEVVHRIRFRKSDLKEE